MYDGAERINEINCEHVSLAHLSLARDELRTPPPPKASTTRVHFPWRPPVILLLRHIAPAPLLHLEAGGRDSLFACHVGPTPSTSKRMGPERYHRRSRDNETRPWILEIRRRMVKTMVEMERRREEEERRRRRGPPAPAA